ncbi:MAG: M20 family peptidase, partial [Hungatella sp.]
MIKTETNESAAIALTKQLVRIDSSDPGAYETEIGAAISAWFADRGIATVKDLVLPGRYNLLARIEGETADPGLVYLCHMDTVTLGDG